MKIKRIPRIPLEVKIDVTYRCNNNCRHCWSRLAIDDRAKDRELTFLEIKRVVQEARDLGCQRWVISGGEPMLREDFSDIFDLLTRKSVGYTINTNGTLITKTIARLMKRRGQKLVALYGATAEVCDRVTRTSGSFENFLRGVSYLKEAGAGFAVQIIPMRSNWHQYAQMLELAASLSGNYRIGSAWLYYSACGSARKNQIIDCERLAPNEVVALDPPNPGFEKIKQIDNACDAQAENSRDADDRIFKRCIDARRDLHIDPYGGVSFCAYVKDPALRYDLKAGSLKEAWEGFIPNLADRIRGGEEYIQNCHSCKYRTDCRWCGIYGFLECGRYSAPVPYLCEIAKAAVQYKAGWKKNHRRYYRIAGITLQIDSDLPIHRKTFARKFKSFESDERGDDTVHIRLHFEIPDIKGKRLGEEVYRHPPHAIYKHKKAWIYLGISNDPDNSEIHRVAVFTNNYSRGDFYVNRPELFENGYLESLTPFSSDQIFLTHLLALRRGFSIHAAGVVLDGEGLLFTGPSEAGKTTMSRILMDEGEVLCDETIIVRKWDDGFRIHGTWSHGELPNVSASEAPLKALFFLEKSSRNCIEPILEKREILRRLLPRLFKPLATSDWWEEVLSTIQALIQNVPAFVIRFDTSGKIKDTLKDYLSNLK